MYNCNDLCLHIFLRSSKILSFIYSLAFFIIYGIIANSQCDQISVGFIISSVGRIMHRYRKSQKLGQIQFRQREFFFSGFNFTTAEVVYNCDNQSYLRVYTYLTICAYSKSIMALILSHVFFFKSYSI